MSKLYETNRNTHGTLMMIIEYNSSEDVLIEFQDAYKYKVRTHSRYFRSGKIRNPYDKVVCNIGFMGVGKYSEKTHPKIYNAWKKMLYRCYDPYFLNSHSSYRDVFC